MGVTCQAGYSIPIPIRQLGPRPSQRFMEPEDTDARSMGIMTSQFDDQVDVQHRLMFRSLWEKWPDRTTFEGEI